MLDYGCKSLKDSLNLDSFLTIFNKKEIIMIEVQTDKPFVLLTELTSKPKLAIIEEHLDTKGNSRFKLRFI
jgi:hypothetical protein